MPAPFPPRRENLPHPFIPQDLLEHLEKHYPDRAPDPSDSERVVWMKAGAADLVRKLRHHFTKQTEEAMRK